MSRLFETIRIENGIVHNLSFHQQRMDFALSSLFDISFDFLIENTDFEKFNFFAFRNFNRRPSSLIDMFLGFDFSTKKTKCKIVYSDNIESIEFEVYNERSLKNFKLVSDDDIDYSYKYLDRSKLELLFVQKAEADDVIILKNNLVTDSSYANLIFFDGKKWATPSQPLLCGTMRANLLKNKIIFETEIHKEDLKNYSLLMPINSMLSFDLSRSIPINSIINLEE